MAQPIKDAHDGRLPDRFAARYQLHEVLGRGGMAVVYRATDLGSGRSVALKHLLSPERDEMRGHVELLFEREFHTLSQLKHPCVIEVYDYGVTPEGDCYYTMELLDGGVLRDRCPLPWREACRLLFDVCSSLALLHSRRLLHRDISPRNVHCTRTGAAKLIDFGAVAPMTADGSLMVGTPAFTAPETVHRSATDGRTDLYSLGATLYYALTGRLAYPARSFSELLACWNQRPLPPSGHVPEIPAALDDLVMSLLDLEPALRPPSAFAVMQRLAAIAGLESREAASVSRAYLATPALVGRSALLAAVREHLLRALSVGGQGVMLRGPAGIGRSRLLDACVLEAKTLGARVLRANARGTPRDFEVALALAQHLLEALPTEQLAQQFPQLFAPLQADARPKLRELDELQREPEQLERSLVQLMRAASKAQPLVFAVDDVHCIDEPSAAVLATLIDRFRHGRAFAVMTAPSDLGNSSPALDALSRRCEQLTLEQLSPADAQSLFGSVFGDVPNLGRISEEIYQLATGNPRASLDLAQHLIDRGVITYAAGIWSLPNDISAADLPPSAEAAIRARIEQLSPLARFLAQAHALSFAERLTYEDYRALSTGTDPRSVDAAVSELIAQQALVGDGASYLIANRVWSKALVDALQSEDRKRAHAALAALFEPRLEYAWIQHVLASESPDAERALDALLADHARRTTQDHRQALESDIAKLAGTYPRAIELARCIGRPARQLHELRHALLETGVAAGDPTYYWMVAPEWREQLIKDSGLDLWKSDVQNADAAARLTQALTKAFERHAAQPEHECVYRPDEAIKRLAEYVSISIAIGVRTMDYALLCTLPSLLEPFAPLSPLVAALWHNALSCVETRECRYERARSRWIEAHESLAHVTGSEVRYVQAIRNAIAYGVGMIEAFFGLPSAARWADELDQDPYQRVSALYLRRIVRLSQGDWPGADKLQRSAELLALRARVPQMFSSTMTVEISVCALALDLAGVRDVIDRERSEAAREPGWLPYLHEAEARFELVRGDFAQAKTGFEQVIALTAVDEALRSSSLSIWVTAHGGLCEALLGLERAEEARTTALAALDVCEKLEIRAFAYDIVRMLARAEAKLGDFDSAVARLERLIAEQTALGVSGLRLGITYEARAEIALWHGDAAAFETFARLTAREYRYGAGCPLGARYERLTREARRRGIEPVAALSDFEPSTALESDLASSGDSLGADPHAHALRLIVGARAANGGHLYLASQSGLQLMATYKLSPPSERLREHIDEYLEQEADRFDSQTVAIDAQAPAETRVSSDYVDGVEYELLLLTGTSRIVGVVAIAPGPAQAMNPRESQLLASIAEQLVSRQH